MNVLDMSFIFRIWSDIFSVRISSLGIHSLLHSCVSILSLTVVISRNVLKKQNKER